jgi:hypothetical protein
MREKRIIAFDFDGTLTKAGSYETGKIEPNFPVIKRLREYYSEYLFIVIFTARPQDDFGIVSMFLKEWNIPYDSIVFNKIRYDVLYDDKAIGPKDEEWPR